MYFYAKASWSHQLPRTPGTMGSAQLHIKQTAPGTSALVSSPSLCQMAFPSRPRSVQKWSIVAFCSWPQKSFASFYLPRLLRFPVWNMPKRYLFSSLQMINVIASQTYIQFSTRLESLPVFCFEIWGKIADLHKKLTTLKIYPHGGSLS